jgi:hypothetical protein
MRFNRRDFLKAGGAITAAVIAGALISDRLASDAKKSRPIEGSYDSSDHAHYPDRLTKIVTEGLEADWKKMAVFPGMFLASPGAKFYNDVALKEAVDLGLHGSNRTVILRPVFPGVSLTLGTGHGYEGKDKGAIQAGGMDSDTFAFFHPAVGGVVFGNYGESVEQLNILTRFHGGELAYTSKTNSNIPVQDIDVKARRHGDGVIIPAGISFEGDQPVYSHFDPNHPDRDLGQTGNQMVISYYAIAQGRNFTGEQANEVVANFALDDPVLIPDHLGPVIKLPKEHN